MKYSSSIFIFRRDLRLIDNTGLLQAVRQSHQVLPIFIFDPRQIDFHPYQSQPGLQFMRQSITELRTAFHELKSDLSLYHGLPAQVLRAVVAKFNIRAVFVNRDYTPFSRRRDEELAQTCAAFNVDFISCPDYLLTEPENALKSDGQPYRVFTPFWRAARQLPVALPETLEKSRYIRDEQTLIDENSILALSEQYEGIPSGGRAAALAILNDLGSLANYDAIRDFPGVTGTSQLSAHLKFGTCSIREAYYAIQRFLGPGHPLLRQLYWRDFFTHITFHYPYVIGKAFHSQYDKLPWENNKAVFQRWCDGTTGFPIVDAGMRELNTTGFMHNRVRMIVASFLTKDLHISWRWGERYFARHLVDYDPAVNNGNWQWAASTGCDAQPYFRIFNPWLQQKKFDPDCIYIKRWLPELKLMPPPLIHNWHSKQVEGDYPAPLVEHSRESLLAKEQYRCLSVSSSSALAEKN